jgi:gliding motility-associated peptidyl-prolyl isomerase
MRSKTMKNSLYLMLLCFFFACQENKARYPLNKSKEVFLNTSASRNKALLTREESLIRQSAQRDSLLEFQSSEKGFLYAYIKKSKENIPLPKKGTPVRFEYQIEDLNKSILYEKSELGTVDYLVDQEDLVPALREGIRLMRPKEVVVFLFPSYLCYGYQGDGDKIGVNQPLRFTIERLPIN